MVKVLSKKYIFQLAPSSPRRPTRLTSCPLQACLMLVTKYYWPMKATKQIPSLAECWDIWNLGVGQYWNYDQNIWNWKFWKHFGFTKLPVEKRGELQNRRYYNKFKSRQLKYRHCIVSWARYRFLPQIWNCSKHEALGFKRLWLIFLIYWNQSIWTHKTCL